MPQHIKKKGRSASVLFTGGIGDVIAITSFMSQDFGRSIKWIYWAALRGNLLRDIFDLMPEFKGFEHVMLLEDFPNGPYFESQQVFAALAGNQIGEDWTDLTTAEMSQRLRRQNACDMDDWSIRKIFPRINCGELQYHGCPFVKNRLADISHIDLPDNYYVIQGSTPSNPAEERGIRDLLPLEWDRIGVRLGQTKLHGVVLNAKSDEQFPIKPHLAGRLVDRRGLTLAESMEVLKDERCVGYLGIDSWLSVLACHRFQDPRRLVIRTKNKHYTDNLHAYCAPHTQFSFVHELLP